MKNKKLTTYQMAVTALMAAAPAKVSPRYSSRMAAALRTAECSNLRWKSCGSSRLRKAATALAIRTASVVTFMPPAVEPGAPPVRFQKLRSSLYIHILNFFHYMICFLPAKSKTIFGGVH